MRSSEFDLDAHFSHSFASVTFTEKKDYSGKLNLSSNQLEHPELASLFHSFLEKFNPLYSSQYVFCKFITNTACNFYNLEEGQLIFTAGSDIAIATILKVFTISGKKTILQVPNYSAYKDYSALYGIDIVEISFLSKTEAEHTKEIISCINNQEINLVVISNPNNTLGTCLSVESIKAIASECYKNNIILLLDEAYCFFNSFDHVSLLSRFPNIIIVRTFSKSHGLAGLRLGCIISSKSIIRYLKKTGLEKTVSVVTLHYFDYLMEHDRVVHSVRNDIIQQREELSAWLEAHFHSWYVYQTCTNFVTLQLGSTWLADKIVDSLNRYNICIKRLQLDDNNNDLIRISISSKPIMDSLKLTLLDIKNTLCDSND